MIEDIGVGCIIITSDRTVFILIHVHLFFGLIVKMQPRSKVHIVGEIRPEGRERKRTWQQTLVTLNFDRTVNAACHLWEPAYWKRELRLPSAFLEHTSFEYESVEAGGFGCVNQLELFTLQERTAGAFSITLSLAG